MQLDAIGERAFQNRDNRSLPQLVLGIFQDSSFVPGPAGSLLLKAVELTAPLRAVFIDLAGPDNENVEIAMRACLAASDRAEHHRPTRRYIPRRDCGSESFEELCAQGGEGLDVGSRKMLSIEPIEIRPSHAATADHPLGDQALRGVADTVLRSTGNHAMDVPPAELGVGACQNSQDISVQRG